MRALFSFQKNQVISSSSPAVANYSRKARTFDTAEAAPGAIASPCAVSASPVTEPRIQAKLVVGAADDLYEQEADRAANEVMAAPTSSAAKRPAEDACDGCRNARDESGAPAETLSGNEEEQSDISGGNFALPSAIAAEVDGLTGGGEALAQSEREFMESRFGHSFANVRVHTDTAANRLARTMGARAFTLGHDVVFGENEYRPGDSQARHVLAHELTHVLQQQGSTTHSVDASERRVQRSLTGPPQFFVSATTRTPETYSSCRGYNWVVDWSTNLQDGFIIQEITNSGSITQCDGTNESPPNTPHFWEAWPVTGGVVGDGGGDLWFRAQRPSTRGEWRLSGEAHAVQSMPAAWGFTRGGVADANGLLSTTTGPNKDTELYPPTLSRTRAGEWNCCDGNNYHRAK